MSANDDAPGTGIGGAIGARLAPYLAQAVTQARIRMGPHQAGIVQRILADFTNHVSDEVRGVMGPLWQRLADDPSAAPWVRDLARSLGNERGQAWAWIGGSATGAALGSGLITLLTNELQPIIGTLIAENPHIPFTPDAAAAIALRGLGNRERLARDAAQAGMDGERFTMLTQLQAGTLNATDIQALYARGWISHDQAVAYFHRAGYDGHHAGELLRLARNHVSLPDAAAMANRSIVDMDQLREIARINGYDPSDAERFFELTGEPLPISDALTALRRGIIDQARANRAWVQGPIRNEWFDTALALQYAPMSTVDAADAVNQGHLSMDQGRTIAEWNGLMPEHFQTLIENAGIPPGVELATEALNRGLITEDEFRRIFLESRLKNRYVSLYKELRYRVIPQETVRRLYRLGRYTRAQALERLQWAGFSPLDADVLLSGEDGESHETERELTKSEVLALYADHAVDRAAAAAMLDALGYSTEVVEWQLNLADLRRDRKYVDAVLTRVRAGFVAYRLTQSDAETIMDALRIPPAQRDESIDLWKLEQLATTRGLTVAQIQAALRRGLVDTDQATLKLLQLGYSDEDAGILVALTAGASR